MFATICPPRVLTALLAGSVQVCSIVLPNAAAVAALLRQQPDSPSPDHRIEMAAEWSLNETIDQTPVIVLETGLWEAGRTGEIVALLRNETGKDIRFSRIETSCSCGMVEADDHDFLTGETDRLKIRFRAPASSRDGAVGLLVRFVDGAGNRQAQIAVTGTLAGNLHVEKPASVLEAPAGQPAEWSLPIFTTPPIQADRLTVACSDSLSPLRAEIREADGRPVLVLGVDGLQIPDGELMSGTVTVRDDVAGRADRVDLLISRRPPVRIRPSLLRFYAGQDNEAMWEANALIAVSDPGRRPAATSPAGQDTLFQSISAVLDGQPVELHVLRISRSVSRLTIRIPRDGALDGPRTLQ